MKSLQKTILSALFCFLFLTAAISSSFAQPQPLKEGQEKFRKIPGYRHGPSYFKINNLVETTPIEEGVLDFKHFHTNGEMISFYKKWVKQYPDLLEMYVAGKGFGGTKIIQLTLTNKKTGRHTDKPAMFIDANRHSGEVTAAESALWMLNHMLTNYGKDPEITKLIDKNTFYFRPQNNPDGSELYLNTAQTLRSTIRPDDNDGDGLLDEDPAEDLDGDGFVRQMRVKVPKGEGYYIVDPDDKNGILMRRVKEGEEGDYNIFSEGIDNDGDGSINEDGVGGLDLHRNYPENWRPNTGGDETGRGWTQRGAGEFPLSESETRSLVLFLLKHPHISIMNTMDTTVPMHLRPPSTSKSEERMYPEDLDLYKHFDEEGKKITKYERAGDVYFDYGEGNPLFGHSPDFGYFYYGAIWYGDELWNGGRIGDEDGDGEESTEYDKLLWNQNHLKKIRFQEWTKVNHPDFGEVEVGGWNPKFWRQNPPPEVLEEWAEKQAMFNLMLAKNLPEVYISDMEIKDKKDGIYEIEVVVENRGYMPTALLQAQLIKIVRPDMVSIEFPEGYAKSSSGGGRRYGSMQPGTIKPPSFEEKEYKIEVLTPEEGGAEVNIDRLKGGEKKKVKFKIKLNGIDSVDATIKYISTRGGVISKEIKLGGE